MSRMSYMRQLYRSIRQDLLLCHIASCDVIWCHIVSCDVFKLDITSVATNSAKSPSQRAVVSYYITWRHMISHDNIWCSMMLIPCYGHLVPHKVTISSFTCHMSLRGSSLINKATSTTSNLGWLPGFTRSNSSSVRGTPSSVVNSWKSGHHMMSYDIRWRHNMMQVAYLIYRDVAHIARLFSLATLH